jgi:SPP1 gp7 family putative phage head morphogenesis protein
LNRLKELAGGKSGRSASNAITESELARMLLDQDEWIGKMRELLGPKLAESYVLALAEAALDLGGAQLLISDPQVVLALAQQELQLVEGVTSTLSKKVKRALLEVFTSADPPVVGTLQHVISELLPELTGTLKVAFRDVNSRALAIARTESAHAANTARFMHMEKEKIDRHEWISSGDEFVRESHARVNGEIKALGDRFSNGMRHPHDPSGPASEVVNCRCVTEAVIG